MKKSCFLVPALLMGYHVAATENDAKREPLTFAVGCAGGDCPLLKGAPQTSRMRGGSVRLKLGESVGWHSTGQNEEALTILHGSGTANIAGHADVPLQADMLVYIPTATRHNVRNTGSEHTGVCVGGCAGGSEPPRPKDQKLALDADSLAGEETVRALPQATTTGPYRMAGLCPPNRRQSLWEESARAGL